MKISTRSWHYRFMMGLYQSQEPRTLCSYFWKLMFLLVITPILIPFVLVLAGIIIPGEWIKDKIETKWDNWRYNRPPKPYKEKNENFVFAYFRAAKSKVCPLIDYVDE